MDFKNVDLNEYCLTLDLQKSMFLIDMLEHTYEFTLKGNEVEIFKKLKSGISEPITRKELIYFIQVEMVDNIQLHHDSVDDYPHENDLNSLYEIPKNENLQKFYKLFNKIDSIHKAIDNIVYLEKYLNEKEESDEEEEGEEGKDEDEVSAEELSAEELKMETLRMLRKQIQGW